MTPPQGAKTSPRLSPRTKPPPTSPPRLRLSRESGRSTRIASWGTTSIAATRKSNPIATSRRRSSGSPSVRNSHVTMSSDALNAVTTPATAAARAAGKDDREHWQHARRDGGDDAREKSDSEQQDQDLMVLRSEAA